MKRLLEKLRFLNVSFYNVHYFNLLLPVCFLFQSYAWLLQAAIKGKCKLRGNIKILKALVLSHVKKLENEMVKMLLVAVSLVCTMQLYSFADGFIPSV